jgi:hypothetical protein
MMMYISIDLEKLFMRISKFQPKSLGYCEVKKHKPCMAKESSKLLQQRKQVKLQWYQDTSKINGDNLNHITREASRHFRNKKGKYF